MKIVVFGLSISSSWGNGHATLWRGLVGALTDAGCTIVFYERDVPYYAAHRDLHEIAGGELVLYTTWLDVAQRAERDIAEADVAIVTSYCPDARAATDVMRSKGRALKLFYDLDTPVTLACLDEGREVGYIGPDGLATFDLVLSYTGGAALGELRAKLGARHVAALYGHVDPELYRPVTPVARYVADLTYLGTYAADRQEQLEHFLIRPAGRHPGRRFVIGGAQYPQEFPWHPNIWFVSHLPPAEHPSFFSSSRLTLNVTRQAMARMGWCPSGRLFEASACGAPVVSDSWPGLDEFYEPGEEIIVVRSSSDVSDALGIGDDELRRMAGRARDRTLAEHTSAHRARTMLRLIESARSHRTSNEVAHA